MCIVSLYSLCNGDNMFSSANQWRMSYWICSTEYRCGGEWVAAIIMSGTVLLLLFTFVLHVHEQWRAFHPHILHQIILNNDSLTDQWILAIFESKDFLYLPGHKNLCFFSLYNYNKQNEIQSKTKYYSS